MQKIILSLTALLPLLVNINTYAVYKNTFGLKFEAGLSINSNIKFKNDLFDVDNDGPSPYKITSQDDSFFAAFGFMFPVTSNGEVTLEALYGYNSKANVKLTEKIIEDTATGPNVGNAHILKNTGLINIYLAPLRLKINKDLTFIPFIQAGAGVTHNYMYDLKIKDNTGPLGRIKSNGEFGFAWNVGIGFNINEFGIGYRYMDYGIAETKDEFTVDYTNTTNAGLPRVIKNQKPFKLESIAHIIYVSLIV